MAHAQYGILRAGSGRLTTITADREEQQSVKESVQMAKTIRALCAPEIIMVVASRSNEAELMLHASRQAGSHRTKIALVHVTQPTDFSSVSRSCPSSDSTAGSDRNRGVALERILIQLLWKTVVCESVVLRDVTSEEIPFLVKSMAVDRVVVGADVSGSKAESHQQSLAERLISTVQVPVCVVSGHGQADPRRQRTTGRILLAVSLYSDCEDELRFACLLAEQYRARLTVLHVFRKGAIVNDPHNEIRTAAWSHLPLSKIKKEGLICPLEIVVREGDPAREILDFNARMKHDFIIMGSPSASSPWDSKGRGVTRSVIPRARSPLIVLGPSIRKLNDSGIQPADLQCA